MYLNSFRRQLDPPVMRARYIEHVGDILASRRDDNCMIREIRQLHADFLLAHREWLALTDVEHGASPDANWRTVTTHKGYAIQLNLAPDPDAPHGYWYRIDDIGYAPEVVRYNTVAQAVAAIDERAI